jgi:ceramide glucosyltransferase
MAFTIIMLAAAGLLLFLQYFTAFLAWCRCRPSRGRLDTLAAEQAGELPAISLVRPLCGLESFSGETLRSSFTLNYPAYELLFCVANPSDPIIPWVRAAMRAYPGVPSQLLIGDEKISINPKLNNMVRGWQTARFDRIAFIDSNVLLAPDFLQSLVHALRDDTGVVSAPPIGLSPRGFWAHLECAFLNTYEARWQYAADALGMGFAQGKTLFYRRSELASGFMELADEPAEDAASTKMVRRRGLKARLAMPSSQPLGARTAADVWSRQLRWARLRRVTFPLEFAPEIITGSAVPIMSAALAAYGLGFSVPLTILLYLAVWYAPEMALAKLCRWPANMSLLFALLLRDGMIPALWVAAWMGRNFTWRGTGIEVDAGATRGFRPRAATSTRLVWNRVRTSWDRAFPR